RSPRLRATRPLPLTFGSGGRLSSTPRTVFPTHRRTDPEPAPAQQQPPLEPIMQIIQELHADNLALRHQHQQQQQQLQGLRAAAPVSIATPIPMRPHKPAEFNGNKGEDIETWLFQVEQYTTLTHVPDNVRACFVATFFCSSAALWWRSFNSTLRSPLECTWLAFHDACLRQFRPVNAARVAREKL